MRNDSQTNEVAFTGPLYHLSQKLTRPYSAKNHQIENCYFESKHYSHCFVKVKAPSHEGGYLAGSLARGIADNFGGYTAGL